MPDLKEKDLSQKDLQAAKKLNLNLFSNLGIPIYRHISGTYICKDELRHNLKCIQHYLEAPDSRENIVQGIIEKLREGANTCTPGFHNRVNNIILMLSRPLTLGAFLRVIRTNLVDLVAHQRTNEVHQHSTFFNHAHFAGFGVNPLNLSDVYSEQQLSNEADIETLATAINEHYTAWSILNDLLNDIAGELRAFYDYEGRKSEGYNDYKIYDCLLSFFKMLLADKHLIYQDIFLIDTLDADLEIYKITDINWHTIQIKLWEKLKNDEYLFLRPEEERFYNKLLSKKEESFQEDAELIQALELYRYPSLIKHIIKPHQQKISSLIFDSIELKEAQSFFKALSYFPHFEEDLNKRAEFYHTKIKAWMAIPDNKTKLAKSQDVQLLANSFHAIAALNIKTQQQILAPLINASNIRILAAQGQLETFQWLLGRIEKWDSKTLQQILTDKAQDGLSTLMWAAQFQLQAFQLLLNLIAKLDSEAQIKILTDKNKEGQNILIYTAFQARLLRYKPLLNLIIKLDTEVQKQILADKNRDGYDILTLAAKFQPQVFLSLLNLIEAWDRQSQINTLTNQNTDGYNLLMLTALFQPQSFQFLLNLIEKWNNEAQKQVLIDKTKHGDNVLIYAQAQPQAFESLLNKIAKLDAISQKQILAEKLIDSSFIALSSAPPKAVQSLLNLLEKLAHTQKQIVADNNKLDCNLLILIAQNHPQLFESMSNMVTEGEDKTKNQILADQHLLGRYFMQTVAKRQPKILESLLKNYFLCFAMQDTYTKKQILSGDSPFHKLSREIRKELINKINTLWEQSNTEIFQEIKTHYKVRDNSVHNALKKLMIMEAVSKLPKQDRATFKQEISRPGSPLYRALNFKRQWLFAHSCFFHIKAKTLSKCQKSFETFTETPESLKGMASSG